MAKTATISDASQTGSAHLARDHRAEDEDRDGDADLDRRQRHAGDAHDPADRHHRREDDRQRDDQRPAEERPPQPDRDHRQQMVEAAERMEKARLESAGEARCRYARRPEPQRCRRHHRETSRIRTTAVDRSLRRAARLAPLPSGSTVHAQPAVAVMPRSLARRPPPRTISGFSRATSRPTSTSPSR